MTWIRYSGPWADVAQGRHIVSAHHDDSDDLMVAKLDDGEPLRPGEVEIDEAAYESERASITAYNAALPPPPDPVDPDKQALDAALADPATDPVIKALIRRVA